MSDLERSWAERLGDVAVNVGTGVAGGAALGPVGMAIGGLVGLARSLTSQPHAEAEAPALAEAAQDITGIADPVQAAALIAADPVASEQFKLRALEVRAKAQADRDAHFLAALQTDAADRAGARAQTLALAQAGSPIAWGAPVVGVLVLAAFGAAMVLALLRAIPQGSETVINVLLGTLAAMATQVVNYYLGSSVGSARKDSVLAAERERR